MRYNEIVSEGIEDKGILKAVFFAGLPGAGKSTVAKRVTDGQVSPKIVNTDKGFEFLAKKRNMIPDAAAWALVGEQSMTITAEMLYHYVNGILPLYIDGTSSHLQATIERSDLLKALGYDTMMIWVDVDLETAIARTKQREREVDEEFIEEVYNALQQNKRTYQSHFGSKFITVNNSGNDAIVANTVLNGVSRFFSSPISNSVGIRLVNEMKEKNLKTLVPGIMGKEDLVKTLSKWY